MVAAPTIACLVSTPAIGGPPTRLSATLAITGPIVTAAGEAEIILGAAESLEFQVTGLTPLEVFLVKVDGRLGSVVEVSTEARQVVLAGTFVH